MDDSADDNHWRINGVRPWRPDYSRIPPMILRFSAPKGLRYRTVGKSADGTDRGDLLIFTIDQIVYIEFKHFSAGQHT